MGYSISAIFTQAAALLPQVNLLHYIAVPSTLTLSDVVSDDELPSNPDPSYKGGELSEANAQISGVLVYIPARWTTVTFGGRVFLYHIPDSFSGLFSGTEDAQQVPGSGGTFNTTFKVVITHSNTAGNAIVSVTQTGQPSLSQEISDTMLPVQVGLFKEVSQNPPFSIVHEKKTINLELEKAALKLRLPIAPIHP